MYKTLLIALGVFGISACTEQPQTQTFACDNQLTATLTSIDNKSATLKYNQKEYQLTKKKGASGVKYSNDNALFWSKGSEAMLIIEGNKQTCNLQ
ncbi:MAG: MliC family protein [Pseudoalteromonas sp.]|uniref:MliC family protein n=1 Tax=unclassified Pseudoalteromonas TaxID=194690 RepID=UPI003F9839EB